MRSGSLSLSAVFPCCGCDILAEASLYKRCAAQTEHDGALSTVLASWEELKCHQYQFSFVSWWSHKVHRWATAEICFADITAEVESLEFGLLS